MCSIIRQLPFNSLFEQAELFFASMHTLSSSGTRLNDICLFRNFALLPRGVCGREPHNFPSVSKCNIRELKRFLLGVGGGRGDGEATAMAATRQRLRPWTGGRKWRSPLLADGPWTTPRKFLFASWRWCAPSLSLIHI